MYVHHVMCTYEVNSLISPSQIEGSGEKYTADHILVAVGGKPTLPNITGVHHGITSDGFFALTSQPRKVPPMYFFFLWLG